MYSKEARIASAQGCTKAVDALGAHTTTLCDGAVGVRSALSDKVALIMASSWCSTLDKLAILLQFENGLRITEILQIRGSDINQHAQIHIKSLKGSSSRMASVSKYHSILHQCRLDGSMLFEGYSRFYFYRLYKSLGLYAQLNNGTKCAVTHVFRHLYIEGIVSDFRSLDFARSVVGHKSISSTEHYAVNRRIINKIGTKK